MASFFVKCCFMALVSLLVGKVAKLSGGHFSQWIARHVVSQPGM